MTISSTARKTGPFSGTGAQTAYPFNFKVFASSDVLVVQTDSAGIEHPLTLGADYSVALNADQDGNPGGTVNLPAPLPAGQLLTLSSAIPLTQGVSIPNMGGFYPRVIEQALDRLTIAAQQAAELAGRCIRFAISDSNPPGALPTSNVRAGKFLAFDAGGNPTAASGTGADAALRSDLASGAAGASLIGLLQDGLGAVKQTVQDALRERVSVTRFGAKMDGVTDDGAALTAAVTYCKAKKKALFIPGGTLLTSQPIYASGLHLHGEGEMNSELKYTGAGVFVRGDPVTIGAAADGTGGTADTAIYDAVIERLKFTGPGTAGSIGIDGDMYRSIVRQFTFSGFETAMQVRGAIVKVSRGRVENGTHGIVVRPYKNGWVSTTITIEGVCAFFFSGNAFWIDHVYKAGGNWPADWPCANSYGGAASIVFRDTVAQNSGIGYKVNRGAPVIFDNAYSEQNTKSYEITSSVNPTFLRFYTYSDANPGTFDWADIPEQGQGGTHLEDFGARFPRLFIGAKNARGGAYNDFATLANRAYRGFYSGGHVFLRDPDATTTDLMQFGSMTALKKFVWSLQSSDTRLQLDGYTDAGVFAKNLIAIGQTTGNVCFGYNVPNDACKVSFNGAIGSIFDNVHTLGIFNYRWSTIYAGTGTINTSDEREKQQVQPIDAAALRAWAKVEYCQFKFNDAVQAKGNGARWHFGVIAQRVKEAFESEGLDAFAYGVLCHDVWEAEPAVLAKDGTVEREARPAGDRYGIRYEEALVLECALLRSKLPA